MKKILSAFILASITFGCKNSSENSESEKNKTPELTVLEKVAQAHGYDNFKNIEQLTYTFNVDRDTIHFERSWQWQPQKNQIKMLTAQDTLEYVRENMDSIQLKANQAFINDKYWLLFPFQLVWDQGFQHSIKENIKAPISEQPMTEITIAYDNKDGYTPGDTYKVYVDKDFIIREWSYTPSGSNEPRLATTWEKYQTFNGLKIATTHQNKEGNFKLYFTNIKAK
ncbi:hypothetical protein SAMN04488096_101229 [Mesonia phycicola]|uniref:Uncharacterized protein n=1 Tax=Mesonia phycicola TaxID=579105 RepID=A0A1M6AEW9_9FLAO|nr:hypothetical protein [Mesonia phycicola]SHI34838.1 hypothetical protein SAMN04488096_101229 [Mesonia phycicola]